MSGERRFSKFAVKRRFGESFPAEEDRDAAEGSTMAAGIEAIETPEEEEEDEVSFAAESNANGFVNISASTIHEKTAWISPKNHLGQFTRAKKIPSSDRAEEVRSAYQLDRAGSPVNGFLGPDESPIYKMRSLTMREAVRILLTTRETGMRQISSDEFSPAHASLFRQCYRVPRMGAGLGSCTYFLNLEEFDGDVQCYGDINVDGYAPWGNTIIAGRYFVRRGKDFERVNAGDKPPPLGVVYDLIVKERRSRRIEGESTLHRRIYTVEDPERVPLKEFGALIVYEWRGPVVPLYPKPHGNSRKTQALGVPYTRSPRSAARKKLAPLPAVDEEDGVLVSKESEDVQPQPFPAQPSVSNFGLIRSRSGRVFASEDRRKIHLPLWRLKESDFSHVVRESLTGRFVKTFTINNDDGLPKPIVFCAQDRQLDLLRGFGCFRSGDRPLEKRPLFADVMEDVVDGVYLTALGMTHPFFEDSDSGEEAFLPVGFLFSYRKEAGDFEKCAEILGRFLPKDAVVFGLVTEMPGTVQEGLQGSPLFQTPCRFVLSEWKLRSACERFLGYAAPGMFSQIFGDSRSFGDCVLSCVDETALIRRLEELRPDWETSAPGFHDFFVSNFSEAICKSYIGRVRIGANLERTDVDRTQPLRNFFREMTADGGKLTLDEALKLLERYCDSVYRKLELAIVHGTGQGN